MSSNFATAIFNIAITWLKKLYADPLIILLIWLCTCFGIFCNLVAALCLLGRTVRQAMTFSGRYTRSPFIKLDHYSDRLEHIRTYDDSTICREWTEKKRLILLMETAITMVKLLTALVQFCSLRPAHNIGLHLLDRTHAICVFVF